LKKATTTGCAVADEELKIAAFHRKTSAGCSAALGHAFSLTANHTERPQYDIEK
jgi:hypothetical protein